MIENDYVSFEQAKVLKELGFPQDGHEDYYLDGFTFVKCATCKTYAKVTLSLVQKWLREEKALEIIAYYDVDDDGGSGWYTEIHKIPRDRCCEYENIFDSNKTAWCTYDLSLSSGIDKCIELLKSNKS